MLEANPYLDDSTFAKGVPHTRSAGHPRNSGLSLFNADSQMRWPALILKDSALKFNANLMAKFCAEHELLLAPHGKTASSPQLWQYQQDSGAWGVSVATPQQADVYIAAGAKKILLANQLVDPIFAQKMQNLMDADPEFEFYCFVDSTAGIDVLQQQLTAAKAPVGVLVEIGTAGGRAGCRTRQEALRVAEKIAQSKTLRLSGVATYEGSISNLRTDEQISNVRKFLISVLEIAQELKERYFAPLGSELKPGSDQFILSAGGSIYFDVVADIFGTASQSDSSLATVIRSGAYLTHDHGFYRNLSPLGSAEDGGFRPAAEVWGQTLSTPEPGLVIVNTGRRDLPFDQDLPTPIAIRRGNETFDTPQWSVRELNDHHTIIDAPLDHRGLVGDLVLFGTSHPCTLHDKWAQAFIVDDAYTVINTSRSYF